MYGPEGLGKLVKGGHPRRLRAEVSGAQLVQVGINETQSQRESAHGLVNAGVSKSTTPLVREGTDVRLPAGRLLSCAHKSASGVHHALSR